MFGLHHVARHVRRPLPHVAAPRRVGCDEPRPGLLRRVRGASAPTPGTGSRAMGSRSRSGAATTCRWPRSARSSRSSLGLPLDETLASLGAVYRRLTHDSQLRWLGPEKGVMHMAISAVVNALWDLAAKRAGKPLWKLLSDLSPEQLVELVDFRYLTDALTPDEALEILRRAEPGRAERERPAAARRAIPAYTTTPGWLGYSDAKLARLCAEAVADGYEPDQAQGRSRPRRRRAAPADRARGLRAGHPDRGRRQPALGRRRRGALDPRARAVRPLWVEEPTSPDDVLGHAAIRRAVRAGPGRHRRARAEPRRVQAAHAGRGDRRRADRRRPGRGRQREHRDPAARREVRAARSARTPAASGSASWCSTCRCSTTWPCPAPPRAA